MSIIAAQIFNSYNAPNSINKKKKTKLECGPMPNMMAAQLNTGGAPCSTQQSLVDAQY